MKTKRIRARNKTHAMKQATKLIDKLGYRRHTIKDVTNCGDNVWEVEYVQHEELKEREYAI